MLSMSRLLMESCVCSISVADVHCWSGQEGILDSSLLLKFTCLLIAAYSFVYLVFTETMLCTLALACIASKVTTMAL